MDEVSVNVFVFLNFLLRQLFLRLQCMYCVRLLAIACVDNNIT